MEEKMAEEKMMEFRVDITPASLDANIGELRTFIQQVKDSYVGGEVTLDNYGQAKADLAALRKLQSAISAKVNGVKKDLMQPFTTWKDQVDDACRPIAALIDELALGVSKITTLKAENKRREVEALRDEHIKDLPQALRSVVADYWDPSWTNASTTKKRIEESLDNIINSAASTLEVISGDKHEAALLDCFKRTWSYLSVMKMKAALQDQDLELEKLRQIKASDENQPAAEPAVEKAAPAQALRPADLSGSEVLMCQAILVGTRHEILQGVKAFRSTGAAIKRMTEFRKATVAEVQAATYSIKEER